MRGFPAAGIAGEMTAHAHTRTGRLRRGVTVLALVAAVGIVVWVVAAALAGGNSDSEDGAPPRVTLADVLANPQPYIGRTVTVAGRVKRRSARAYELVSKDAKGVLLVSRRRPEVRPYARRGDRVEVIGEVRAVRPRARKAVAAEMVADEVLLFDRADEAPPAR